MENEISRKFSPLYSSARHGGADVLLNRGLGIDEGTPVPLGISHGVDFGFTPSAMDINLPEPLHWAYNDIIFKRANPIKRSIILPHPWWFATLALEKQKGEGILVVPAPPSRTNDLRLYKLLRRQYPSQRLTVLVKDRGFLVESSKRFWSDKGINVVSAGKQDSGFYERLARIILCHERMVCCTLSSAAFFAASAGKRVDFLEDYFYRAYEVSGYLARMEFEDSYASKTAAKFIKADRSVQNEIAQSILGFTDESLDRMRSRYLEALSTLPEPIHNYTPGRRILAAIALRLNRPGMLMRKPFLLWRDAIYPKMISEVESNEISIWLYGANKENLKIFEAPYIKNVTEPGWGFDQFSCERLPSVAKKIALFAK